MASPWHLGIDFGTSNSAAAHTSPTGGGVEAIALSHRSNLMPSAVYVRSGGSTTNDVLTGDVALREGRRDPSRLVLSPKRFIDHDTMQLEGDDVPTRLAISSVIKSMVDRAKSQHAGEEPFTVTLTHPERWSSHAVGNLVDAAKAAGIAEDKLRLISEPRAAAIHYAASSRMNPGQHVAVFDFGGGTLDIAVLRAEQNGDFRVVAAKGDNSLGGRTIDNLVFRWVVEQIDHEDPDLADALRAAPASVMNALQENIREAKEMLSDTSSATITISSPAGERDILITRDEFNRIIDQPVQRAAEMTEAVLREAGVGANDAPIFLTGGSSRIPYVQDQLGKVGRVTSLDDPKTVVARGAVAATIPGFSEAVAGGAAPRAAQQPQTQQQPQAQQRPQAQQPQTQRFEPPKQQEASRNDWGNNQPETRAMAASPAATRSAQPQGQSSGGSQASGYDRAPASSNVYANNAYSSPSSKDKGNGKSKAPMIVGIIAAVALVLGGGVWAAMSLGGDDNGGDQTQGGDGGNGGDNKGDGGAKNPLAIDTSGDKGLKTVTALVPGSEEILPDTFANAASSCNTDPTSENTYYVKWVDPSTDMHYCSLKDAPAEAKGDEYPTGIYVVAGEEAVQLMDDLEASSDYEGKEINDSPKMYWIEGEGMYSVRPGIIYYPDSEMVIVAPFSGKSADEGVFETWAKAFGFM